MNNNGWNPQELQEVSDVCESREITLYSRILGDVYLVVRCNKSTMVRRRRGLYGVELLALAAFSAALLLVAQTALDGKYFWAVAFAAISVLFNPFVTLTLSRTTFLVFDAVCVCAFSLSLTLSWREPKGSVSPMAQGGFYS